MVVDHLRVRAKSQQENITVTCIYLNHKEAENQTPDKLLSGLWRQLVHGRDVGPLAKEIYEKHLEECTSPLPEEVVKVLCSSFMQFSKVYIIVDAIDEYPEDKRWILLQHLTAMGPTVNAMIMSRPNITPDTSLPNLDVIDICADKEDVRKYVDTQIQRSPRLLTHLQTQPELREEIHKKITETADGM
jgi:hypothetical protein